LVFDAGQTSYSIAGIAVDYAYIGKFQGRNYYVKYQDLDLIKPVADQIWEASLEHVGAGSNLGKIKAAQEAGDFSEIPHLAPGEEAYESARRERTQSFLVGIHAPGKAILEAAVNADAGAWQDLKMYRADNDDDDAATAMTQVSVPALALQDVDTFINMLTRILTNQGQPIEREAGGGADRTSRAKGVLYVATGTAGAVSWDDSEANPYADARGDAAVTEVADLNVPKALPGALSIKLGAVDAVYVTTAGVRERKSANFYIGGKPYTRPQIEAKKDDAEITAPYQQLKTKTPEKQEAETFSRKDRGKGQADAMGKWSANAAVTASNIIDETAYDEDVAWEWLHIRGAGIGGKTAPGNLTPGTFDANSEMIPIENSIKKLRREPSVKRLRAELEPSAISGVFAKKIKMTINVQYQGLVDESTGTWQIDTQRGLEFDQIQGQRLKDDLSGKTREQTVGSAAYIVTPDGLITGPVTVRDQVDDTHFWIEVDPGRRILAERQDNGEFLVPENWDQDED
jgi:hypothetical protein